MSSPHSCGLHLFGLNDKSILANVTNINLKRLYEGHFAFQSIKEMVGKPLNNGTQFLRVPAAHLRQVALKNDKRCGKEGSNASISYGCSDQLCNFEHIQYAIRAGHVPVRLRGVNLGGWLVAENWINSKDPLWYGVPSEVSVSKGGEMQTIRYLGHEKGDARFQTHWNTFIITEEDIANMTTNCSLNSVRVPIDWWILGYDNHDPPNRKEYKTFAPGGLYYLDRLVQEWAMKYNLKEVRTAKVTVSPPDSEKAYWSPYPENIDNTIEVAHFLAAHYRYTPSFLGVELLNKPTSSVRRHPQNHPGNDFILVTSPILWEQNPGTSNDWENFMPSSTYTNIWHDWHNSLIWGDKTADWIMTEGVALIAADIAKWTGALIIGEWCLDSPT
uniref:glucan 1,3-beta-glucosidase n=1 Tax=Daphnia galeata TaxID=27404 RepID=A0A8J2R8V9_9CRUS|nr:unnamed protein product [Daphnia galeata]